MRANSPTTSRPKRSPLAGLLQAAVLSALLGLFLLMMSAGSARASGAELQVIHNAADPAAAVVDVYVNGDLLLDDFAFRAATPFVPVPAGVELIIGVAPGDSDSADDALATFPVTLESGKRYVAVANGVLGAGFAPNPDGRSIEFTLFARDGIRTSGYKRVVKLLALHGASDAPAVDIRKETRWGAVPIFRDLSYGDFSEYRWLPPRENKLLLTLAGQPDAVVATYTVDLTGLGGGAAVVFASGFLDPDANNGGPAFGLFAALPDGNVVEFATEAPMAPMAELQVIHNAADPAVEQVDVYVNGGLLLDDFTFRAATPFVPVPAGVELNIGVAPANSSGPEDILATFPVTLEAKQRYVVMANGVLGDGFAENPDGASIGFSLYPYAGVSEGTYKWLVKVLAFHGSTDAPTVDVVVPTRWWGNKVIVNDLSYGEFSGERLLLARNYTLAVTPGGDNDTVVAAYEADLSGLGGGVAVVFASGFLDPAANNNGPAFGLYVALADGTVIPLPPAELHATLGDEEESFSEAQIPSARFGLDQNYPNPFNPRTTISFSLPEQQQVSLRVYNQRGELVRNLVDGTLGAGPHSINFDGQGLATGMYFYQLRAGDQVENRKMILAK